jgi:hypothetical protein
LLSYILISMKTGNHVSWKWGRGHAKGIIKSVHSEPTTISSGGKTIKRNGTKDNPALVISRTSGNNVLKLSSEIELIKNNA